jgi:pyruvate dehydrogenase E2 component (dihydrolipoamide acetyltransferase)
MTDVTMPQMGESIAEGTLTKWLKGVGEKVERDEPLFEISTDKVDAEIPSPASGVLARVLVQAGSTVPINTVVAVIASEQEAAALGTTQAAPAAAPQEPAPAPPPVSAPMGGGDTPGAPAPVPPSTPAAALHTVAQPIPPAAGPPARPPMPPAAPPVPTVSVQALPVEAPRPPQAAPAPTEAPTASTPQSAEPRAEEFRRIKSSPVVQKIAIEHGVDLAEIQGTGLSGRVTKQNVLDHIETRSSQPAPAASAGIPPSGPPSAPAARFVPSFQADERVEVVPMSPVRRKTAEHMVQSRRISAHVSTIFEIDMTRIDQLRRKHRQAYEERSGVKLTYVPFILKAVVDALKANPILNASVDGDRIVYKREVNIGLAVDLNPGLIVPVIRNADEKNVLGLARTAHDLAERARIRKLKVDEIQGGTFTVTNPGVFGSLFGTPIIHQPQVGILAVGVVEKRPVVRDDAIAIRTMAYFALTFDHRLVDGADADRFMGELKRSLQDFDETAL